MQAVMPSTHASAACCLSKSCASGRQPALLRSTDVLLPDSLVRSCMLLPAAYTGTACQQLPQNSAGASMCSTPDQRPWHLVNKCMRTRQRLLHARPGFSCIGGLASMSRRLLLDLPNAGARPCMGTACRCACFPAPAIGMQSFACIRYTAHMDRIDSGIPGMHPSGKHWWPYCANNQVPTRAA